MNLLDEVIKVQEEVQKLYEKLAESPNEEAAKAAIQTYRDRLELLRTLREATFLISVIEDDNNERDKK